ncbi:MAG: ATP-binding cassette domain-containing protein [bacterium]|nr:ATP-binding cassette domain-containing protein [bacterium]
MSRDEILVRFDAVSYEYSPNKLILREGSFVIRRGAKLAIMGQNGAGKTTLFRLITGDIKPEDGAINIPPDLTIATARQVIPRDQMDMSVRAFFEHCFTAKVYDIDPKIDAVLEVVNLVASHDRIVKSFSGGQQARLLLASALIQEPDLLLLDEPTNNLDTSGIQHLTQFLADYKKTCIVISHDAEFLNAFTHGVLYLDIFTHKLEQYVGNYFDVIAEISMRIEKENRKNAQLAKEIQANKDKANVFSHKGGQMRMVAKRMREKAEELEEEKIAVRKEDKTIRPFIIPHQPDLVGEILHISSYTTIKNHKSVTRTTDISLKRNQHLLLQGPNGIGKSTLLESLATRIAKSMRMASDVKVGYYRQDFLMLDFDDTIHDALMAVMDRPIEENMRSVAAGFLLTGDMIRTKIGNLSEGQKGLTAFARLVLQKPGLLILDEPTNHINFRHIPIIAEALNRYEGAMILVSHVPEFVAKIRIDCVLDLEK